MVEVDGRFDERTVTIAVRDSGTWGGQRHRKEGGYGLPLVRRLMDTVEVETGTDGTSITLHRLILRANSGYEPSGSRPHGLHHAHPRTDLRGCPDSGRGK